MFRVCFQNGPDAAEIVLDQEFETKDEAKKRLGWFAENYGTVEGAVAWVEGDPKPAKLVRAEAQVVKEEEAATAAAHE
jgi:hypothetical protein